MEPKLQGTNAHQSAWPEDPRTYVTAAQVARKLGYASLRAFYRDKAWLEARGFPPQPLKRRWRAGQIEAWECRRELGIEPDCAANDLEPPLWPPAGGARDALDRMRRQLIAARIK